MQMYQFFKPEDVELIINISHRMVIGGEKVPDKVLERIEHRCKAEAFGLVDKHLDSVFHILDEQQKYLYTSTKSTIDKLDLIITAINERIK